MRKKLPNPKCNMNSNQLRSFFAGKTVAVVGNSFTPTDVSQEVDSSDIVIRFNLDPVRKIYGYTHTKPPVPTGEKTTVMAGFLNRMYIPRILALSPGIEILIVLRPNTPRIYPNYKRAGLYETKMPVYMVTKEEHKSVSRKCRPPVMCGMSLTYLLSRYNTAKKVTFYNFNFYVPALNQGVPDVDDVYMACLAGKKGKRLYGFPGYPHKHNLTRSYQWFKAVIAKTSNFQWAATPGELKIMGQFL